MFFEYIMYVMYVIASAREAPSACIYRNRQKRIKSLKMVGDTSDINQFPYFHVLNPCLKLTWPDHDAL